MRVCHVINCLSVGGTERQLVRLVQARGPDVETVVVTLLDRNTLTAEVEAAGVRVRCAELHAARPTPAALLRVASILREERPDVVQSWLYYANAAATLARPLAGGAWPLAWNLRQTVQSLESETWGLRTAFRLNRWLSSRPDVVVSNSQRSLDDHRRLGFRLRRELVIPNGIDVASIACGDEARARARERLGLPPHARVVGIAGRSHALKDHPRFLEAFAAVASTATAPTIAVMAGRGVESNNPALAAVIAQHGLADRVHLLSERLDLAEFYAAMDCYVSSSAAMEAFPNVVAEAMAAGVPVVATDVGECREVVASWGLIVPPRDTEALAAAIAATLTLPDDVRRAAGAESRASVQERFGIRSMALRYEDLWRSLRRP